MRNVEKKKTIQQNTSIIDINIIEAPLFISSKKEVTNIGELEKKYDVSTGVKRAIEILKEDLEKSPVPIDYRKYPSVYRTWVDSKGKKRELFIIHSIPDMTTMDVWNGLIGLYIQKISPICFDESTNTYDIASDEMEFTLYELAKFMNKSTGGKSLERLIKEIYKLKYATYHSLGEGVIFNKKNDKYLRSKGKGFNLILDCEFESEKRIKGEIVRSKCKVQFNRVIIDNIRYEYIKYINPKEYFSLPSRGLSRRLYSYIKGNLYLSNKQKVKYIKRSFKVLKNKIPIYDKQPSKIKERLISGLKYLKAFGIISDYFFGDEVLINNVKERCVYIIFDSTKEDIINQLTQYKQLEIAVDNEEPSFKVHIPENLKEYLINKGFNEKIVGSFLAEYDKWEIIKYCLWLEEKEYNNKKSIRDFSAMLTFALKTKINIENTHKHIIDFIEKNKRAKRNSIADKKQIIEKEYQKYLDKEIQKLKREDEGAYKIIYDTVLDNLNSKCKTQIKQFKMFDKDIKESERENWENQKKLWLEFEKKNENSKLFKDQLQSTIRDFRKLKYFDEFKREYKE
ncbi:replication initiator protein A (plasmid) [Haloimpatiens sp. FM7330]|uniref:replication initiator protein A n=1 Tax=Haloimpatiens sp. FM7330 TaxID=3298610 RepID=UPI003643FF7D